MTSSPIERVTQLESDAFRVHAALGRIDGRLDHLTSAVGDLSQDARGVALDIRELRTELGELRAEVQAGFAAVLARLDERAGK